MRKLLIKLVRYVSHNLIGLPLKPLSGSSPLFEKAPVEEDLTLYRMPFKPVYEKIIHSLRSKGWQVLLEINTDGELEYVVYLNSSPVGTEGK